MKPKSLIGKLFVQRGSGAPRRARPPAASARCRPCGSWSRGASSASGGGATDRHVAPAGLEQEPHRSEGEIDAGRRRRSRRSGCRSADLGSGLGLDPELEGGRLGADRRGGLELADVRLRLADRPVVQRAPMPLRSAYATADLSGMPARGERERAVPGSRGPCGQGLQRRARAVLAGRSACHRSRSSPSPCSRCSSPRTRPFAHARRWVPTPPFCAHGGYA